MTHGVPAGDILREMDFEDLGVVRVGDPLDPEVAPVHVRLDNDDSADVRCRKNGPIFSTGAKGAKSAQIHPIAVNAKAISKSPSRYP